MSLPILSRESFLKLFDEGLAGLFTVLVDDHLLALFFRNIVLVFDIGAEAHFGEEHLIFVTIR